MLEDPAAGEPSPPMDKHLSKQPQIREESNGVIRRLEHALQMPPHRLKACPDADVRGNPRLPLFQVFYVIALYGHGGASIPQSIGLIAALAASPMQRTLPLPFFSGWFCFM